MYIDKLKFRFSLDKINEELKETNFTLSRRNGNNYPLAEWKNEPLDPRTRKSKFIEYKDLLPESKRAYDYFQSKLNVPFKVFYILQRPNVELLMHKDPLPMQCSINMMLSGNISPITFDDIGDVYYDVALVDIRQMHGVKSQNEIREMYKFCIDDLTYEEAREKLKDDII